MKAMAARHASYQHDWNVLQRETGVRLQTRADTPLEEIVAQIQAMLRHDTSARTKWYLTLRFGQETADQTLLDEALQKSEGDITLDEIHEAMAWMQNALENVRGIVAVEMYCDVPRNTTPFQATTIQKTSFRATLRMAEAWPRRTVVATFGANVVSKAISIPRNKNRISMEPTVVKPEA